MSLRKPPVILTIDDESAIRESIKNYLTDYDYTVIEAENGRLGLEMIHSHHPDLVLVDLRMPEVNGLDVLKDATENLPDMPILVVSGTGSIPDVIEALHLGAWDYILKPIQDLSVMRHAVDKNLERARLIQENRNYQQHLESEVERRTQALRENEATLRVLLDAEENIACLIDLEGNIQALNEAAIYFLGKKGKTQASLIGKNAFPLFRVDQSDHRRKIVNEVQKTGKPIHDKEEIDGRHFEFSIYPVEDSQKQINRLAIFGRDMTDRINAERQKERDLHEKEMLLKEIHHRVKNNLQVICSLLSLQSRHVQDPASHAMFTESRDRVRSMALVHELLYGSNDLAHIDFSDYIRRLANALFKAYQVDYNRVSLGIHVENVSLGVDLAIPCGLIINELISNALKHAFPAEFEGEGRIEIKMTALPKDEILLEVQDNGKGVSPGVDLTTVDSLGLHLVRLLSEDQLKGKLTWDTQQGTRATIHFHREPFKIQH